jgi:hypothetical protein
MELVGYVMLSALVLYMVQQIADLAAWRGRPSRWR